MEGTCFPRLEAGCRVGWPLATWSCSGRPGMSSGAAVRLCTLRRHLDRGSCPPVCLRLRSGVTHEPGHKEVDSGRTRRPSWPSWPVLASWKGAGGAACLSEVPFSGWGEGREPRWGQWGTGRVVYGHCSLARLMRNSSQGAVWDAAPGAVYSEAVASLQLLWTQG